MFLEGKMIIYINWSDYQFSRTLQFLKKKEPFSSPQKSFFLGFLATFICFCVTHSSCYLYFVVNQIKLQSKVTKLQMFPFEKVDSFQLKTVVSHLKLNWFCVYMLTKIYTIYNAYPDEDEAIPKLYLKHQHNLTSSPLCVILCHDIC